jgi:hypothetical protein
MELVAGFCLVDLFPSIRSHSCIQRIIDDVVDERKAARPPAAPTMRICWECAKSVVQVSIGGTRKSLWSRIHIYTERRQP